jgi:hypothetical protein
MTPEKIKKEVYQNIALFLNEYYTKVHPDEKKIETTLNLTPFNQRIGLRQINVVLTRKPK